MARTTRTHLGLRFSEGARQAWREMAERELTASDLRGQMTARDGEPLAVGVVDRVLYGDADINLHLAIQFQDLLGVEPRLWLRGPLRTFVPPAARKVRATSTASTGAACSAGASR